LGKLVKYAAIICIMVTAFLPFKTNAAVKEPFENLGPQVEYVNIIRGKAGVTATGKRQFYALLQGEPAKLIVIDLQTKKMTDMKELPGAKAAWAIDVDNNGNVWVGTTPNEHVFRYDPVTKELADLGKATTPSDTVIWDLDYDEKGKRVFGVTSYGGRVFYYHPEKGFVNLGQAMKNKLYARSVVYDETEDVLYVGVGSPAALIKWDLRTNIKMNILPSEYADASSVYDLDLVDGQLFIKLEGQSTILQYSLKEQQIVSTISADSRGVSNRFGEEKAVYYSFSGQLYKYNYETHESIPISSQLYGSSAVSLDIVNLYGNPTLVGMAGNGGRFFSYSLVQNNFSITSLKLPPQSVEIYNIGSGPSGEIYSSGFISGYLGVYDPNNQTRELYQGLGQVEGMVPLNGKMYFGVYPNARIYEYDPSAPWQKSLNPKELMKLDNKGQDRPVAMVADEENDRLFIGTLPKRGYKSGALIIYDTKAQKIIYENELVANQSITSLAYDKKNNVLYVGTSVYDGNGKKAEEGAKLMALPLNDLNAGPVEIPLTLDYTLIISALYLTNDGKLWGIADNKLFVFDSEKKKKMVIPITSTPIKGMSKTESLLLGRDRSLYGTLQGTFFKVNPDTYRIAIYRKSDVLNLAQDQDGNLYFNSGPNLWKIHTGMLTKAHEIDPEQLTIPHVPVNGSPIPIARIYAKKPLILFEQVNGGMIPRQTLKAKGFYRVYGTKGQYYNVGGNYYVFHEGDKINVYIGRIFSHKEIPIYKPDGTLHRMMRPGEELRVYNFDDRVYDVGGGYTVVKSEDVTYYVGTTQLLADTYLYRYGQEEPVLKLNKDQEFMIYNVNDNKLDIGNGFYLQYEKDKIRYRKN
jgi:hypothetical protein